MSSWTRALNGIFSKFPRLAEKAVEWENYLYCFQCLDKIVSVQYIHENIGAYPASHGPVGLDSPPMQYIPIEQSKQSLASLAPKTRITKIISSVHLLSENFWIFHQ